MTAQTYRAVPNTRRARVRQGTIYSEVVGQGSPLLLLHGLGASTRWWQRNIAALAYRHEVHILDMHGFGRSSGQFVLCDAADILAEWMQHNGIMRSSLIGHSMGGYIAANFAHQHPLLVDKLVLVDPAISVSGVRPEMGGFGRQRHSVIPCSMVATALYDLGRAGLPTLAKAAHEMMTRDMGPILERIKASTLLIWGEHDSAVPVSMGRELARRLQQAKLRIIAGAGHVPMWEKPQIFNRTVADFLAGAAV